MDVVNETKEKVREVTARDGKKKSSLAKRVLVPLAASARALRKRLHERRG